MKLPIARIALPGISLSVSPTSEKAKAGLLLRRPQRIRPDGQRARVLRAIGGQRERVGARAGGGDGVFVAEAGVEEAAAENLDSLELCERRFGLLKLLVSPA